MRRWFLSFAIACCLPLSLLAQRGQKKEDKFGFFLQGNMKFTRIPFEMHANLIVVPVHINGSDTLHFILDTGVSSVIITNPNSLKREKLKFTRKVVLTGAGEGESLTASVAIGNTLEMGKMKATYQNIVVLEQDVLRLSEYVGIPIDGIFGYEVFNNFVVTIDFVNKELLLNKPESYKYRSRHGDRYPIVVEDTKPYADVIALVDNGQELPIRVVIDTGAGHALLIDKHADNQVRLPEKVLRAQLGRGLNGVINGNLGRIDKVRFGKYELDNVLASFPDSLSFGMKFASRNERQGNIGCELLRRFKVTFNYADRYIVLKPVKRRLKETFEHDMSGIEFRAKGQDFKDYIIDKVVEDSPAWDAGLQEGDELLFINNKSADDLIISEIYKLLQKGEGKEIAMLVRRKGVIHFAKFQLKRMI
ncbi:aspartyl protease family protein [Runella defluvii]|uniref:aspartyl protease family protein n=1 Tax=Runella defluvii TaxID=370973 RepID=UPI001614CF1B|nr:aspartyl protease family protein [Runella defluvii]